MTCSCEYPCSCNGPVAQRDAALIVLADLMRRQHAATLGNDAPLPWHQLTEPNRGEWLNRARAYAQAGPAKEAA